MVLQACDQREFEISEQREFTRERISQLACTVKGNMEVLLLGLGDQARQ